MWRGVPISVRRPVSREVVNGRSLAPLRGAARFVGRPVPSWVLFNATFLAWHLPGAYDAALTSGPVHAVEHLSFFATALLFWTRVIDSPPWRSPLSEPAKLVYLSSTLVLGWILAIVLATATSPVYSVYANEAGLPGGISPFTDQQLAAGIMWVPGSVAYTVALILIAYRLLEPPTARTGGGPSKPLPRGVG
jgi:cytochrome c oxidase assembly factor CtaG